LQITYSCFACPVPARPHGRNPLVQILAGERVRSLLIWIVLREPFPRGLNNASVQVVDKSRAVRLRPTRLCGPAGTSERFSAPTFGQPRTVAETSYGSSGCGRLGAAARKIRARELKRRPGAANPPSTCSPRAKRERERERERERLVTRIDSRRGWTTDEGEGARGQVRDLICRTLVRERRAIEERGN